jgi:hypothetical protein
LRSIFLGARAVAVALVLVAVLAACGGGGSAGPLAVESVAFMRDDGSGKPGATVTSFKPSDRILHAKAQLNQMATGFNGKIVWIAVDTEAGANIPIAEVPLAGLAANVLNSQLELPSDWPVGKYRVDFYSGDTVLKSGEFTVQP